MAPERPIRILVVDDEPGIRAMIRRCLTEPRFRVIEGSNGEEALKQAGDAQGLDLLITDQMMPGMQGDEVARRLRRQNADLKVLYLTAYSDRLFDAKQHMWEREAYLDKPFTVEGLREAVAMLMVERLSF